MFHEEQNRFVYKEANKELAEITWVDLGENVINVNHTFVDPSLRGKGMAEKLVQKIIEKAQKEQLKIMPSCSYVVHYFENHPEYANLVV